MKLPRTRLFLPLSLLVAVTSAFALPASANAAILVGMESNRELVNTTQTPELQAAVLDKMKEQGVQVVRANFRWYDVAEGCAGQTALALENHENPCYVWERLDSFVSGSNDRQMSVLLSISQNPVWLHNTTNRLFMGSTVAQFNRTLEYYASFHKAAGARYKAGSSHGFVKFWTIHNEPNSKVYWAPAPNAARYAQLYGRTAVALRSANPAARIAPGPTGPTGGDGGIKPLAFLRTFQAQVPRYLPGSMANKKRYINAYAHNPYPGAITPPNVFKARGLHPQAVTMGTIDRLFKELDRAPITRGTKVWATEFGWETTDPIFKVTLARQAQFIAEAFDWLDGKRRVEIGISYGMTDPPARDTQDWTSGTIMNNGIRKPSFKMFQRMVSVPQAGTANRVRRGTVVRVWGRSNVNPAAGRLAVKVPGKAWTFVPGQRKDANRAIRASMRITSTTITFAVWDPSGGPNGTYGPARTFRTY